MAGQDEAMATLAAMLQRRPPTADEQGSPEEWGPGRAPQAPKGDKLAAMRMAHEAETKGGGDTQPDFSITLRLMNALKGNGTVTTPGQNLAPIPKNWKLPEYIRQQFPAGIDPSGLHPGDMDKEPAWLDPENPKHQELYKNWMLEQMAPEGVIKGKITRPKAPARKGP